MVYDLSLTLGCTEKSVHDNRVAQRDATVRQTPHIFPDSPGTLYNYDTVHLIDIASKKNSSHMRIFNQISVIKSQENTQGTMDFKSFINYHFQRKHRFLHSDLLILSCFPALKIFSRTIYNKNPHKRTSNFL